MAAMTTVHDSIRAMRWDGGRLALLDQRRLPQEERWLILDEVPAVADAISAMVVRGAPAIGITAAYAVVIGARHRYREGAARWKEAIVEDLQRLRAARPTAINLAWAVGRMERLILEIAGDPGPALEAEALRIHKEDIAANHHMGALGAGLLDGGGVLTHCNTGSLATGGYGTALGVVRSGCSQGRVTRVYADETRPWLQGSRLTAWELIQDGIPVTLLCEGAAGNLMAQGRIRWVVVGADRIAANGDTANKIGTYALAVLARYHGIGFMVVAPTSTLDLSTASGRAIPLEERPEDEVLGFQGSPVAPQGAKAWNPVFDVTPAELITVLVTERGVLHAPQAGAIARLMKS